MPRETDGSPPHKILKPNMSLEEFCIKSKLRYSKLINYKTLHKFSIVWQICDEIVNAAFNKAFFNYDDEDTISIE